MNRDSFTHARPSMPLNSYGQAFLSRPAARGQRLVAFTVAVFTLLVAAGFSPFAADQALNRPLFVPVWMVCLTLSQGFTGLLLALQASHLRHPTLALLAGAYTFLALATGFQLLAYPGLITVAGWPDITHRIGPWLNVLARFSFPLWALLAVWRLDQAVPRWLLWMGWLVPSLMAAAIALTVVHSADLPILVGGGHYAQIVKSTILPGALALNAVVLGLMVYQTRLRTRLHLWLCVVLMGHFSALLLIWLSDGPNTVGWYGAHGLTAAASLILLAALLWDIHDIHRNLQHLNARLHEDATHDNLTGLLARKPLMEQLNRDLQDLSERGTPCAMILVDVDNFKAYNDAFGHLAGDACLTAVAQALRSASPTDLSDVARYGGEEFAILLRGKAADKAEHIANVLRHAVWREQLKHSDHVGKSWVSISAGVAVGRAGNTADILIDEADLALYAAKAAGRNCVKPWVPGLCRPAVEPQEQKQCMPAPN